MVKERCQQRKVDLRRENAMEKKVRTSDLNGIKLCMKITSVRICDG